MRVRPATLLCSIAFALANAVGLAAVLWLASQPIDYLYRHVVVDDAIYYVKPALNLAAGRGYAFDGVHRTNGVQPLWAVLVAAGVGLGIVVGVTRLVQGRHFLSDVLLTGLATVLLALVVCRVVASPTLAHARDPSHRPESLVATPVQSPIRHGGQAPVSVASTRASGD